MNPLLTPKGRLLLLGDEAVVRGALEAGVGYSSSYPGTPASEIGDVFCRIAKEAGIYSEYATNEKTALESAAGAAFCGVRSIVSFKHFGLNVASDSLFPLVYYGVKAGMVIVFSDDPNCWSSAQSEQDSRCYAKMAHMPMLEPSTPQEAKDFTKLAFELSTKFGIPVMIRLTTRACYARAPVALGRIVKGRTQGEFTKERRLNTMVPFLLERHKKLHDLTRAIEGWNEKSGPNRIINAGKSSEIGIITSGASFGYTLEALEKLGLALPVLKLGLYPYPKKTVKSFISNLKTVLIVEEIEGFVEHEIKAIAGEIEPSRPRPRIIGTEEIPPFDEMKTEYVTKALSRLLGLPIAPERKIPTAFFREAVICPGCPHRASFWATKAVTTRDTPYSGDVGCYTLGIYKPIEMEDYILAMGAGMGASHGISKAGGKQPVAIMGESTFFHSGIPALINAVYNKSNVLLIILDNGATAMTGHQPNPASGITGMGETTKRVSVEDVAKACGAEVATVNPFDVKKMSTVISELMKKEGVKVLVSRQLCRLIFMRNARKNKLKVPVYWIDPKKCKKCGVCVQYGCPAIHVDKPKRYYIDPDFCWGCTVCSQVCPYNAISVRMEPEKKEVKK